MPRKSNENAQAHPTAEPTKGILLRGDTVHVITRHEMIQGFSVAAMEKTIKKRKQQTETELENVDSSKAKTVSTIDKHY